MVGETAEPVRDAIHRAVDDLARGVGRVVLLPGARGTGRSELLAQAAARARGHGIPVLELGPMRPFRHVEALAPLRGPVPRPMLVVVDDLGETDAMTRTAAATAQPSLADRLTTWIVAGEPIDIEALERGDAEVVALPSAEPATAAAWTRPLVGAVPASDRETLGAAALLGQSFDPTDLGELLGIPVGALVGPLSSAVAAGVLQDDSDVLRFAHPLVARTFQRLVPAARRRELTRRVVDVLVRRGGVAELTAGVRCGRLDLAALDHPHLVALADLVAARDPGVAATIVARAIAGDDGSDPGRLDGLLARAASYRLQSGDRRAAAEYAERLDDDLGPELAFALAEIMYAGQNERSRRLALRADPGGHDPASVRLAAVVLAADSYRGRAREDACLRVARLATLHDDSRALGLARIALSMTAALRGDLGAALREATRAGIPPSGPAAPEWWIAGVFRARMLADVGRIDEAESLMETLLAAAESSGQMTAVASLLMARGILHLDAGRLDAATLHLSAARHLSEGIGLSGLLLTNVLTFLAHTARMRGDTAALHDLRTELEARLTDDEARRVTVATTLMFLDDAVGTSDGVDRWALWAENVTAPEERPHYAMATGIADAIGRLRLARQRGFRAAAARLADSLRVLAATTDAPLLTAAAAHADGLMARDVALVRRAAAQYREFGRPLLAAQALEDVGELDPDPGRSASALEEAEELWTAAGAAREAARVVRSLRERGRRPTVTAPSGLGLGLTAAEERVVRAVLTGATNQEVARALFLSPNTVAVHLRRIFVKTGARSRRELIALVAEATHASPAIQASTASATSRQPASTTSE